MDTKYWGPSGWKFLHLITFAEEYPSVEQKKKIECFFITLPYILPCKFCRASLSEYMERYPIHDAFADSPEPYSVAKWLWKIHNCVNDKLRGQKLLSALEKDPPFKTVKELYLDKYDAGCTKTKFEGWEFLFSVIESHPYSKQSLSSIAIEGAPSPETLKTPLEKNRWNILPPAQRLKMFIQFWKCLPDVLPYTEWRQIWSKCSTDWSSRKSSLKTLWGIRCAIESQLKLINNTDYYSLCRELRTHRSGCSKSRRARTCRRVGSKATALKSYRKKRETR